jgi:hypothetical protein
MKNLSARYYVVNCFVGWFGTLYAMFVGYGY